MHLKLVHTTPAPAGKRGGRRPNPKPSTQAVPTTSPELRTASSDSTTQGTSTAPAPAPSKVANKSELESRRFWKDFKDRTQYVDLDINYSDITRYHDVARGPLSADPISLGSEAAVQVRKVFERYGFPMPATWAELRANHLLVQRIEQARQSLLPYAPRHFKAGLHLLRSVYPTVQSEVIAYLRDDLEGLKRHLREKGAFKHNALAYDESDLMSQRRRER